MKNNLNRGHFYTAKERLSFTSQYAFNQLLLIVLVFKRHQTNVIFPVKLKPIQCTIKENIIFNVPVISSSINTHVQIVLALSFKSLIGCRMQNVVRILQNFNHKTSWAHVGKHIFDRIHFFSKKRFTFVLKFRTLLTLQKLKFYQN